MTNWRFCFVFIAGIMPFLGLLTAQTSDQSIPVHVRTTLDSLLFDEDTDGDKRITVDDLRITGTSRGDKRFWIRAIGGDSFEVAGTYPLSNLLQELSHARLAGRDTALISARTLFEPPTSRISRFIRQYFWDGLTRRIDEQNLGIILNDEKAVGAHGERFLYVPASDQPAFEYFRGVARTRPGLGLHVVRLPAVVSSSFVRSLDGSHGILSLALRQSGNSYEGVPFVVPGGRFNEMYGWDSYFISLGLLRDGKVDLAKAMVDNFIYQINHYGKILNANRTYYLTRSQPPFLTSMISAVYDALPKTPESRSWLRTALMAAIKEYHEVWMTPQRTTAIGLQRYFDSGEGPPPEVEPGHFDAIFRTFAKQHGMPPREFEEAYRKGIVKDPELDRYFIHDRCMRESGHDTSYRLDDCCADLATVDLNSLLYKIETDIASLLEENFDGTLVGSKGTSETSEAWQARARKRKGLMNRHLFDEQTGMFFDYDVNRNQRRNYMSATAFYPLWAGVVSKEQAERLVRYAIPLLEMPGGIVSSTELSRGPISADRPARQWDYPNGWAPHQMLAWVGLRKYGYDADAIRLIYRWLFTVTLNAVYYNGTVTEKYDVVRRSHQVFDEYGNVGTKFSYITKEGFGWTNASYQVGLSMLPDPVREKLDALIPPEWVFPEEGHGGK